jgi:hypothetical protein
MRLPTSKKHQPLSIHHHKPLKHKPLKMVADLSVRAPSAPLHCLITNVAEDGNLERIYTYVENIPKVRPVRCLQGKQSFSRARQRQLHEML